MCKWKHEKYTSWRKIASFNVQSINKKVDSVLDALKESNSDKCFRQETWLSKNSRKERSVRNKAKKSGYIFLSCPRKGKCGGGVGVMFKKSLTVVPSCTNRMKTFEVTEAVLKGEKKRKIYKDPFFHYGAKLQFCHFF